MTKSTKARLVNLDAKLTKKVEFIAQQNPDDEMSATKKAAIGAGVLGAGYAGASILRGRQWQKNVLGQPDNSVSGLVGALKTGNRMNVADAAKFVAPVASKIGTAADVAGSVVNSAANTVADTAVKAGRSSKAALLIAARKAKALV